MLISQISGPGNNGFTIQRETVQLIGVARAVGFAYPIALGTVDATSLEWTSAAAVAIVAEQGSIHVVAEEAAASGVSSTMVLAGQVNVVAAEAFAVGAPLGIDSDGKFLDTIVATGRTVAIALEAASAEDDIVKVAFRGYGSFGINVA